MDDEETFMAMSDDEEFPVGGSDDEDFGEDNDDVMVDDDDDDGDDEAMFGVEESGAPTLLVDETQCTFITADELIAQQVHLIKEISSVLQLPHGTARVLLEHFGWSKEQLMERYWTEDHDKLFADARCIQPKDMKDQCDEDMCSICGNDNKEELLQIGCGHGFCHECWVAYLEEKILSQGKQSIECPEYNCNILVDESTVTSLLKGPAHAETLARYYERVADAIVDSKKTMRWCPAPDCKFAVIAPHSKCKMVKCKCGFEFCFQCGQENHTPVLCLMLKAWLKKCADDSETSNWLQAHTKPCPKCASVIEKNGGCNHMSCRKCKHEFCWICLGDWEPHGSSWFNCTRFNDSETAVVREKVDASRSLLKRYLFYFDRFKNHQSSRQFEEKLVKAVDWKMKQMQKQGWGWVEVQFLIQAVATLQQARRVLQYTYVFAYYLKKTPQCLIFEENQADLQMQTERLSEYLEQRAAKMDDLHNLKQQVMNLRAYCEHRLQKLVEHVEEGYKVGFWEYDEKIAEEMVGQVDEFNESLEL
ncbi:ariadne protein [Salpingoeca rosetta]|uniref:RBR-type E3 ubiquitin transferase n=1 Tax=Salpingoeca rosetta (strain ATCC 50818 / BSB-021) TaxID=946362 RepID=F2UB35_SALR5|nr:ariadne protein [Salpingoeca rosetta]EGD74048.1 ariadne protein [Salpingoeca rosetta]|eukprot:XP_004993610.1 ariadne protein [Salpingoeca rosetta]